MTRTLQPCGTTAAVRRHQRRGEPLCELCRATRNADRQARRQADPGDLRWRYGITLDEKIAWLDATGWTCHVCGNPFPDHRAARIDHDHSCCPPERACGMCRRGLLCDGCNLGVGHLRDDPVRLRAAAAYLERARA